MAKTLAEALALHAKLKSEKQRKYVFVKIAPNNKELQFKCTSTGENKFWTPDWIDERLKSGEAVYNEDTNEITFNKPVIDRSWAE